MRGIFLELFVFGVNQLIWRVILYLIVIFHTLFRMAQFEEDGKTEDLIEIWLLLAPPLFEKIPVASVVSESTKIDQIWKGNYNILYYILINKDLFSSWHMNNIQ